MAREKFIEIDSDQLGVLTGVQLTKLTYWVGACTVHTELAVVLTEPSVLSSRVVLVLLDCNAPAE